MTIQLPNGNTAQITLDKYLDLSDEEYNEFLWKTIGSEIEDPFFDSPIKRKKTKLIDTYNEYISPEDIIEESETEDEEEIDINDEE